MSKQKNSQLVKLILTAVLIAINILLERLPAFKSVSNHISLSIITTAFAAVYLGIPHTVALTTVGDILGSILFPFGAYSPLFTITNAVSGLIIALFLNKKATVITIGLGVVVNKLVCTLLLNSLWISLLYQGGVKAFPVTALGRVPQAVTMCVVEIVILMVIFYVKSPVRKQLDKAVKL